MENATAFEPGNVSQQDIERFQQRSRSHTFISYFLLFLVVLLLALAVYIFFFAQTIESRGGSATALNNVNKNISGKEKVLEVLESTRSAVQAGYNVGTRTVSDVVDIVHQLKNIQVSLNVLNAQKDLLVKYDYVNETDTPRTLEEARAQIETLKKYKSIISELKQQAQTRFDTGLIAVTDIRELDLAQISIQNEIDIANIKMDTLPAAKTYVAKSGNYETIDLIRVNILRFGGISVTLFLIALIIPIYRYNIRLANFYLSRADALILCKQLNYANLPEILDIMTPKHAFEKEPITPIDSLGGIFSNLSKRK